MLLCVGAINTHLIKNKLRGYASINAQTGEALDTIHLQHLLVLVPQQLILIWH